jgi:hypothetical protein
MRQLQERGDSNGLLILAVYVILNAITWSEKYLYYGGLKNDRKKIFY